MAYYEGITISGMHSYYDFGLNIASRKIDLPPKNSIRKTIPFMNGFYDFTKINGGICWGARPIAYTFDIVGSTVEEMDAKRTEVVNWLCNQHDVDIYDDTIPDYHFHGSYDSASQSEDGEKSELTVTFTCYPFMIANEPSTVMFNENDDAEIVNNGQPVKLKAAGKGTLTTKKGVFSLDAEEVSNTGLILNSGENIVTAVPYENVSYPFYINTKTENGLSYTVSEDGTINISGTATANTNFHILYNYSLKKGTYYMSGLPKNISGQSFRFAVDEMQTWVRLANDLGTGAYMKLDEPKTIQFYLVVEKGKVLENVAFKPSFVNVIELAYVEEVL